MQASNREDVVKVETSVSTANEATKKCTSHPILGIAAGTLAALLGTALWILITKKYQLTWMSVAIAFGIAFAIRYIGNARQTWYGVVGAFLSIIVACIGNLATAIILLSKRGKTPLEILSQLDFATAITLIKAVCLNPIGIVIFGLTIYIGFYFSFQHFEKKTSDSF